MSKARPHAHIYEKWVRGIRQAVPDEKERCGLYEYIFAYQFARVYDISEFPKVQDLSSAAAIAFALLEGDLDELCEARKENNERRKQNGASIPNRTEQDQAGTNRPLQVNTIQSNTSQFNAMQALTGDDGNEFALGLKLLREGYNIQAERLHIVYEHAKSASDPAAYAVKCYQKEQSKPNKSEGEKRANFVELTGCKHTYALEVASVRKDGDELSVVCPSLRPFQVMTDTRMQEAARAYGAKRLQVLCNGHEPFEYDL